MAHSRRSRASSSCSLVGGYRRSDNQVVTSARSSIMSRRSAHPCRKLLFHVTDPILRPEAGLSWTRARRCNDRPWRPRSSRWGRAGSGGVRFDAITGRVRSRTTSYGQPTIASSLHLGYRIEVDPVRGAGTNSTAGISGAYARYCRCQERVGRNPIDRFILARLTSRRITSSCDWRANRRTPLARRVSLDA